MSEAVVIINPDTEEKRESYEEWNEPPISDGNHFKKYLNQEKFLDDKEQIKEDTIRILKLCRNPNNLIEQDPFCSAGLIIGDIQSGKTASMETVSSIARDNNYQVIIIISGIVENLTSQTFDRFYETFNEQGWLVKKILSAKQEDNHFHQGIIENTKNEIIDNLKKWQNKLYDDDPIERKTVVIVIPKHPNHMGNVALAFNDILKRLSHPVPTLIIDDESDQQTRNVAGRNNEPERKIVSEQATVEEIADALDLNSSYLADLNNMHIEDIVDENQEIITREAQSPNYASIKRLRSVFPHNSYLMYTATSQAELLMNQFDEMRPKFHWVLTAGNNYTGYDFFFDNEDYTGSVFSEAIPDEEVLNFAEDNERPDSIETALNYFIVGVAIGRMNKEHENKKNNRSMFVNMTNRSRRETDTSTANISHENIRTEIDAYISYLRSILETFNSDYQEPELESYIDKFRLCHEDLCKQNQLCEVKINCHEWSNELIKNIRKSLDSIRVITLDSQAGEEVKWDSIEYARILIGGVKLGRGFTVEGLTVSYLANTRETTPQDTAEQRARFYGYRKSHASLIKLFITNEIRNLYHEEGINRKFLIDSLRETMGYIGGTQDWPLGIISTGRHPPTRRPAVRRAHISTVVKNRNDLRFTHRLEQRDINSNIDLINKFCINRKLLRNYSSKSYISDDQYIVLDLTIFDILENFFKHFKVSEKDYVNFNNAKKVLQLFVNHKKDNKSCPIILMNDYMLNEEINPPERMITRVREDVNPNRGRSPGGIHRPNDNLWHYEMLRGENETEHPIDNPTLRIFAYDIYDRNRELLRSRVPYLSLHLPTSMTNLRIVTDPEYDEGEIDNEYE